MKSISSKLFKYAPRARPWIKARQANFSTAFPSIKNAHPILCDSILEADYCIWLEKDTAVAAYSSNSRTFELELTDRTLHYTPDFEITLTNGMTEYTEIKPSFSQLTEHQQRRMDAFAYHCQTHELAFIKINATQIRERPEFKTLKQIYFHRRMTTKVAMEFFYYKLSSQYFPLTLEKLLERLGRKSVLALVCEGLFNGSILADLRQPLDLDFLIDGVALKRSERYGVETPRDW